MNVSQNFKREGETYPDTDKFVCKAFGERAKMILDKFSKGDYVVVHGRMQLSKDYVNNKGETVKGDWEVMIEHIDGPFIKKDTGANYNNGNNNRNNSANNANGGRVNVPAPPKPNSAPAVPPTPNRQTPPPAPSRPMPPVPPRV